MSHVAISHLPLHGLSSWRSLIKCRKWSFGILKCTTRFVSFRFVSFCCVEWRHRHNWSQFSAVLFLLEPVTIKWRYCAVADLSERP